MDKNYKEIIKKEYLRCAADPIYFLKKYSFIQHPIKGKIPFSLYDFHERVMNGLKEKSTFKMMVWGDDMEFKALENQSFNTCTNAGTTRVTILSILRLTSLVKFANTHNMTCKVFCQMSRDRD